MPQWQDITVFVLIAAAVTYLGRVLWCWLTRRGRGTCGSCSRCPSSTREGDGQVESLPLREVHSGGRQ